MIQTRPSAFCIEQVQLARKKCTVDYIIHSKNVFSMFINIRKNVF